MSEIKRYNGIEEDEEGVYVLKEEHDALVADLKRQLGSLCFLPCRTCGKETPTRSVLSTHPICTECWEKQVEDAMEALRAMVCVMDSGPKPRKLDAALTWRECDEKARTMADAVLKSNQK